MSIYADPSDAALWLDGDAFRAPAGTALPTDIFASALAGWEAFGGIKAGFVVDRPREVTKLTVWNKPGTYRTRKGDEEGVIKMRPVDMSKATALTLLTGGSIVAGAGGYEWVEGDEEVFALIVRVKDGVKEKAYYMQKAELGNRPSETLNDEDLAGWDMEISALVPDDGSRFIRPFTKTNPLA
jgi:hypothetical protein